MMNEAPGPINFTMFLTLFGEKLQGTDPEEVIKNAFGCFDEENTGILNEERLRELLTTMGDRFTDEDVDEMYREAPIKKGMFDYIEFTRILKHGAIDKDDWDHYHIKPSKEENCTFFVCHSTLNCLLCSKITFKRMEVMYPYSNICQ